eukprot:361568-Chlamydomonas_euryale.AAC.5
MAAGDGAHLKTGEALWVLPREGRSCAKAKGISTHLIRPQDNWSLSKILEPGDASLPKPHLVMQVCLNSAWGRKFAQISPDGANLPK